MRIPSSVYIGAAAVLAPFVFVGTLLDGWPNTAVWLINTAAMSGVPV